MQATATRQIGRTRVEVTQLGLGGGPFGAPSHVVSDEDAAGALESAWEAGIRYFDTAPWYGKGQSEHRVGTFLRGKPDEQYVISSKVGRVLKTPAAGRRADGAKGGPHDFEVHFDYSRAGVLRSHEDSLQRLGITAIDLAVVHDLDLGFLGPQERMDAHVDQLLTSGWRALEDLRAAGTIHGIGFGINLPGLMTRWLDLFEPDFFLVAGPYTLMDQVALQEELARCVERGVSVIIGAVFGSGILASPEEGARYLYREPTTDEMARARRLDEICREFGVPLSAAALQFPLGHPAVAAVIPGAKTADEVRANLEVFGQPVPSGVWDKFRSEGLIAAEAPVPTIS